MLLYDMKHIDETHTATNEQLVWELLGPYLEIGEVIKKHPEAELDLREELRKRDYTDSKIEELVDRFGERVIALPYIKRNPKGSAKYGDTAVEIMWDNPRFIISKEELYKKIPDPLRKETFPNALAGGGQGILIDAYDMNLEADVVVKATNPFYYSGFKPGYLNSRLIKEAITTAKRRLLDEDVSIVTVYDGGILPTVDDRIMMSFFVMEKIDGFSLDEAGSYKIDTVLDITSKLSRAIDKLNAEDIYHRDIKPGNVMLDRYGKLFLLDWGISYEAFDEYNLTGEHGTREFRAPEQAMGEVVNNTDQHALAATAWCLINIEPPIWNALFKIGFPEDKTHEYEHIDDKQALVKPADMPDEVYRVFVKAMSFNPEDRYNSCAEFAQALSSAYEQASVQTSEQPLEK